MKPLKIGTRVQVFGNTTLAGKIVGRWKKIYVVELDKAEVTDEGSIYSTILVHPDNVHAEK